jgi:hypothetical protein
VEQGAVTVWNMGNVMVQKTTKVKTENRFEALKEEELDDVGTESIDVNTVEVNNVKAKKMTKRGEITLDSGAGASCWPDSWLNNVEIKPKKPGVKFIGAEGSEMMYKGRKGIRFRALRSEDGKIAKGSLSEMEFHVTNSTKALASAAAVVEAGNEVVLSNRKGGSYIKNLNTGELVYLKKKGGTFVFDVEFEDFIDEGMGGMNDVTMKNELGKKGFQRQGGAR